MNMYADYIKERLGDEIFIRNEGFATYRFLSDGSVYIVDIYVRPDFRRTKVASEMADEITRIAKSKGCTCLLGTVLSTSKTATESIKVLLGYGMSFIGQSQDGLIFKKEI